MARTSFSGPVNSANGFESGEGFQITGAVLTADLPAAADNTGKLLVISDNGVGDDEFAVVVSNGTAWVAVQTTALT